MRSQATETAKLWIGAPLDRNELNSRTIPLHDKLKEQIKNFQ
jgi:hypothetical protein